MSDELEKYYRQFEAIKCDAHGLLEGLADGQLGWHPGAGSWSIADCLNHLVVTGNESLPRIRSAISEAHSRKLFSNDSSRHSVLGKLLIRWMDAPPKIKFKAPKAYMPVLNLPVAEIVEKFFLLQDAMLTELREANGINLARVKVTNPVSKWWKMSLGEEFALTAAHERRHLWQGWRVREKIGLACPPSPSNQPFVFDGTISRPAELKRGHRGN